MVFRHCAAGRFEVAQAATAQTTIPKKARGGHMPRDYFADW
jgi:hypothetical protein